MNHDRACEQLCFQLLSHEEQEDFRWMIDHDYKVTLTADNLPSAYLYNGKVYNEFPIGYKE